MRFLVSLKLLIEDDLGLEDLHLGHGREVRRFLEQLLQIRKLLIDNCPILRQILQPSGFPLIFLLGCVDLLSE